MFECNTTKGGWWFLGRLRDEDRVQKPGNTMLSECRFFRGKNIERAVNGPDLGGIAR